jgi:UDP-glucose 4-epimerase
LPFIAQVAVGRLSELLVYGDDYPTHDGTEVRNYIHVADLVLGHLKALIEISKTKGMSVWNLGAGRGYSVFEVIHAFESAAGRKIPFRIVPRRAGDMAAY